MYSFPYSQDNKIAFGDDNNDIELVKAVGSGVAMGNATEKLKEVAGYVTSTNKDNGIGCFLEAVLHSRRDP